MRLLFTNNTLDKPAGTELSVFDYARVLKARDHEVTAFSRQQGELAERLTASGVKVIETLGEIPWKPDVIHGHHEWETSLAALAFSDVPVISFCRGTVPWQETPCWAPNVKYWVGVDEVCARSLLDDFGIPEDKIEVVLNGVDLDKFPMRSPLPNELKRVLVLSNYAKEDNYLAQIREACDLEGVECRAVGSGVGEVVSDPSEVLAESDLVFAKGKAALEAVVSGCGLVVCDAEGLGAMVTTDNFASLRALSFAYESMTDEITVEKVRSRLAGWKGETCRETADLARGSASLDVVIDRLEAIYEDVMRAGHESNPATLAEMAKWAASFFGGQTTPYKLGREMQQMWRAFRKTAAPEESKAETVEMHRIMHAFREQEKRVATLEDKIKSRNEKIETLRAKGLSSKKSWWKK